MARKRKKKRWSDLSPGQQRATVAAGIVELGMKVAALADLRRRPAEEIRGPKALWVALLFVNFVGPVAYFAFGRKR
jgi:hypothetical protein